MQVAKLVSGLFDNYYLLRNNNMATSLKGSVAVVVVLSHVTVERRHLWQKMLREVTANGGKLRSFVLCSVKRSMNEKETLLQQSAIFATSAVAAGAYRG